MKRLALMLSLVPFAAFAQINTTLHNLSSTSSNTGAVAAATVPAVDADQICKFCHTPHKANTTRLLWNHRLSTAAATWSDATSTTKGTPLPANVNGSPGGPSKRCLSCHDGSVALGDLYNAGDGTAGIMTFTGTDVVAGGGGQVLAPGTMAYIGTNMTGNHPVSIPYAALSYNVFGAAVTSSATTGAGEYNAAAAGVVTGGGNSLTLTSDGAGGYGVECSTCHNPHGTANDFMLRVDVTGSALCLTCHNK